MSKSSPVEIRASYWVDSIIAAVITVIIGLLIGFVLLLTVAPDIAVPGFRMLITGGFEKIGVVSGIGRVMYYAVSMIMCGLSVGFTMKAGIFNIGVGGQYVVGLFASLYIAIYMAPVFGTATWVFAILAGGLAGAVWGAIQGMLQAYFRINAIICGIMMNYIGLFLGNMLLEGSKDIYVRGRGWTEIVPNEAVLPKFGLDHIFGPMTTANGGFVLSVLICIATWFLLKKTTLGYELKAVGINSESSRYAGISIKRSIIVSMAISGFIAGMGGAMNHLGASGTRYSITDTLPSNGFTGISVALIASSNPIGIIFSGILVAFLQVGGVSMQSLGLDNSLVEVITSVIIYFCAFSFIFKRLYRKLLDKILKRREKPVVAEEEL
jgi:simple sugar transport system permease protein